VRGFSLLDSSGLPVAKTCFDPANIPEALHLDVWRQASRCGAQVDSLQRDWRFRGRTSNWYTDGVVFSHTLCDATHYQRTPRHIRRGDSDCLVLKLQLAGHQQGIFGDFDHFSSPPGTLVLQDWAIPYNITTTPYEVMAVSIPRYLLRGSHLMYRRNPVITWQPDSPQARLLVPILTQTLKSLATASAGEADAYAAGITGLLDGLLLGDRELLQSKYRERDRLEDMRQYLSRHLSDPDLGADHLCRQFHCSRATVYRLFQREGGIATFILRQRLQRCMQEISRMGVVQKGFLEALAHTWGFSSRANLARHFKAYYGITPQQAVEAARSHQNEGQREMNAPYWRDAYRVSRWLESIAPGASPTEPAGAHGGARQGPRELAGH
tara:strand:+ start:195015 stop:196157 length:1143 start_codon:yes stop_codon:yes gene_type:complete